MGLLRLTVRIKLVSCKNKFRVAQPIGILQRKHLVSLFLSTTSVFTFYWAACAPSHKMGFRSSMSKSGLPGEGRHEGLVPRNDVLAKGFI